MKYKKATKAFNEECSKYISISSSQIIQAVDYWADLGVKYLLYLNAGGAIVIVAFMGASSSFRGMVGSKLSLLSFILGLITVGIIVAVGFYRMALFLRSLKENNDKYLSNEIDWEDLLENDSKRLRPNKWACLFGWGAFMMFNLGVILGFISLFTY